MGNAKGPPLLPLMLTDAAPAPATSSVPRAAAAPTAAVASGELADLFAALLAEEVAAGQTMKADGASAAPLGLLVPTPGPVADGSEPSATVTVTLEKADPNSVATRPSAAIVRSPATADAPRAASALPVPTASQDALLPSDAEVSSPDRMASERSQAIASPPPSPRVAPATISAREGEEAARTAPMLSVAESDPSAPTAAVRPTRPGALGGSPAAALAEAGIPVTAMQTAPSSVGASVTIEAGRGVLVPAPHEPAAQVAEAIRVRVDDRSVAVRLDPPELGRVRIDFVFDRHAITAVVAAEQPSTDALLRRHADWLQQALSEAGLDGARIDWAGGSPEGEPDAPWRALTAHRAGAPEEAGGEPVSTVPLRAATDRLDLRL